MSESVLLSLLMRYPHPVAIARRVRAPVLREGLEHFEKAGLVVRRGGLYRVTDRGRRALALDHAVQRSVQRALTRYPS
jgi:hypothetical protein